MRRIDYMFKSGEKEKRDINKSIEGSCQERS